MSLQITNQEDWWKRFQAQCSRKKENKAIATSLQTKDSHPHYTQSFIHSIIKIERYINKDMAAGQCYGEDSKVQIHQGNEKQDGNYKKHFDSDFDLKTFVKYQSGRMVHKIYL